MRYLLLPILALAFCSIANGGSIHKCNGADGVVVYQQMPCESEDAEVSERRLNQRDSQPLDGTVPIASSQRVQSQPDPGTPYQAEPQHKLAGAGSKARNDPDTPLAYNCDDGKKQWMQETPCPATVTRDSYRTQPAYAPQWGTYVEVTTRSTYEVPVEQQGLSRRQLCDSKAAHRTGGSEKSSAGMDSYQRNKLRDRNGC